MNVQSSSIGVFDSGLGGLSVAIELRALLPRERLLYAADNRYCPYGNRAPEVIRERSLAMIRELVEREIKLLVVACNTASAVVLDEVRANVSVPVIGLEPALRPAVALTRSGKIGVLATPHTAASERMATLVERYAGVTEVTIVAAPGLVDMVEAGETDSPETTAIVAALISPLIDDGVDTLVLGCTHFPFLKCTIERIAGPDVRVVDSGAAVARHARTVLQESGLLSDPPGTGSLTVLTTGPADSIAVVAERLIARPVDVIEIETTTYDPEAEPKLSSAWTDSISGFA